MSLAPRLDRLDKNYIINGNFDFWQRGISSSSGAVSYVTADRFRTGIDATSPSIQRSTDVPNSQSEYSLQLSASSFTVGQRFLIQQFVESSFARPLVGKKITLSFWYKSNFAEYNTDTVSSHIWLSSFGTKDSSGTAVPFSTTSLSALTFDNTWRKAVITFDNVPAQAVNGLTLEIRIAASGTIASSRSFLISQVQLIEGAHSDPEFPIRNYAEELQLCQRYYEKSYNLDVAPGSISNLGTCFFICESTTSARGTLCFKVTKRVSTYTMTLYSPGSSAPNFIRNNGVERAVSATSNNGQFGFGAVDSSSLVTGTAAFFQFAADAEL